MSSIHTVIMNVMYNDLLFLFVMNHRVSVALLAHLEYRATVGLDFLDQRSAAYIFLYLNTLKFSKITTNNQPLKL